MQLLLADDHVLFRDAIIQFITVMEPAWDIVTTSNFNDAIELLRNGLSFDLVMLDLRMPGMNGLEGLETIIQEFPKQRTSIISGVAEEHHIEEALRVGACAYFPKTLPGKTIIKAIKHVLNGNEFIPLDVSGNRLMPSYQDDYKMISVPQKSTNIEKLTKREKQVVQYLVEGTANKEIATAMGIQLATVKLHVASLCKKLNVRNRTQAAIKAYKYGLAKNE